MVLRPIPPVPRNTPLEEGDHRDPPKTRFLLSRRWEVWFDALRNTIRKVDSFTVTWNPASVAANTTAEQTVTVIGLLTDHVVVVNKPSLDAGLGIAGARVSAADTLAVTFINATGSSINPGSETYSITAIRK